MASSRKSSSDNLTRRVAADIAPLLPSGSSVLVGLSGGVDSVVLLHLLRRLAAQSSWRISALHVNHGISPNAAAWSRFCSSLCDQYGIPLHIENVDVSPLRSLGIEAAARRLRHAAFAGQSCDFVALAHHADDQVETLFLQLLRGAGVKGASAMPVLSRAEGPVLSRAEGHIPSKVVRPLLHLSRKEILDYADEYDLDWIEDESNADEGYPRNFLRHQLLPQLSEKFPAYRETLTRSTRHFSEAAEMLDDLARIDAPDMGNTLDVAALQALSIARARNLLRYYLHQMGALMPQTMQLEDMLHQLCTASVDANVCVRFDGWQVRRYQGRVYALRDMPEFDPELILHWRGEGRMDWPALGCVTFNQTYGQGISLEKLQHAPVTLRHRRGGESLRPHSKSATRTLKNMLQEQALPPWQRDRLPLLYCGDELVCIPGVAIAADYQAQADEAAVVLML